MKICQCCGQKIRTKTKHNLSKGLVDTLIIFANKLHEAKTNKLHLLDSGLGVNRTNNFQKLRYFNLVKQSDTPGYWELTEYAEPFLKGEIKARRYVITFNNEVKERSEERVWVYELDPDESYWQKDFKSF